MGISTITLQYSSERGNKKNTSYPFRFEIQSVENLKKVAQFDHVCGEYADGKNTRGNIIKGYRSKKSFRKANCHRRRILSGNRRCILSQESRIDGVFCRGADAAVSVTMEKMSQNQAVPVFSEEQEFRICA